MNKLALVVVVLVAFLGATIASAPKPEDHFSMLASTSSGSKSAGSSSSEAKEDCSAKLFPQSYTRTTRLLIMCGFVASILATLLFGFLFTQNKGESLIPILCFLFMSVTFISYFALYEGIGAAWKEEEDPTCRLMLWSRWAHLLITIPLVCATLGLFAKVDVGHCVSLGGTSALMVGCWVIGAFMFGTVKYIWWLLGVFFMVFVILQMVGLSGNANLSAGAQTMTMAMAGLEAVCFFGYAVVWILGATGVGWLRMATEVAWYVVFDLVSAGGLGAVACLAGDEAGAAEEQVSLLAPNYSSQPRTSGGRVTSSELV
mmetsp:Transcript_45579/g.107562  ORF Transcript_45579/g.107562 Transcript_45579/m.107562 type:complete len:315 (-) Transcript_45579:51-995(-)|eukprot:CAMPEP_0175850008 /NCGR_PEP_ID=MMETSP0107_2-20121207/24848_1 /TAXON_ID=195067 ORGANISM="Goniomonas pacifica, Strain CCMP1869" /NCGR_SAMPLE_ID=MMETSP0107_2 /ASSEMBLY_ACC=CAM_ASM_000203 /LENGTH=314 /DNA_ID=CAMNT_0017165243 /DNA_START=10 /DNA_END=954 /DNA_ORIENTATION=+